MTFKELLLSSGLALTLLWAPGARAQTAVAPRPAATSTAGDAATIGPLHLGLTDAEVRTAVGDPEQARGPDPDPSTGTPTLFWDYPAKGVDLVFESEKAGSPFHLVTVILYAPCDWEAASGLSIGGDEQAGRSALKGWLAEGEVVELDLGEDAENTMAIQFVKANVVLALAFEDGKISSIFLGPP